MFLFLRYNYCLSFLSFLLSSRGLYFVFLIGILGVFLSTRVPYSYGLGGFGLFLFGFVGPLFFSFFLTRLTLGGLSVFVSSFVPSGTPLWISPLVVLAETVSYIVRPFVLLLRPFLKISIGFFGGGALGALCLAKAVLLLFVFVLFLYEIFVAVVH